MQGQYRTVGQLDDIRRQTTAGLVPIANFVDRVPKQKIGLLRRTDGNRAVTVKADVAPGLLVDDKVREIRAWLATQEFHPGITIEFKGEDEEQKAASDFLGKALAVALFPMAKIGRASGRERVVLYEYRQVVRGRLKKKKQDKKKKQ